MVELPVHLYNMSIDLKQKNDLDVAVDSSSVDIGGLQKNDKIEFFIYIEYGGHKSSNVSLEFSHKGTDLTAWFLNYSL